MLPEDLLVFAADTSVPTTDTPIPTTDTPVPTTETPVPMAETLAPIAATQITLQVGERPFVTTRETLVGESDFFASLLSGGLDNAQEDGSYFIDADGKLFQHILRYLRRGVFPIFYDRVKGHDYALYFALLQEAKYFQITKLVGWLETKRYLSAVKVKHWATEIEGVGSIHATVEADAEVKYYPALDKEKIYVCPRRLFVHRGKPGACGKDCRRAQGNAEDIYDEEPVFRTLVVREQTVFDGEACLAEQ